MPALDLTPREGSKSWIMRLVSVLVLLLLGLGLGSVPSPASATPCPFHAGQPAAAAHGLPGAEDAHAPTAAVEIVAAAPADDLRMPASPLAPGHPVPEGQPCCHIAGTAALSVVPVLEPRGAGRLAIPRSWLPPRAAPTADIFRPPASA